MKEQQIIVVMCNYYLSKNAWSGGQAEVEAAFWCFDQPRSPDITFTFDP